MRGIIKDILTNWRNPLGKQMFVFPPFTGWPYSFVVTPKLAQEIAIRITGGTNVATDITLTYEGGAEQTETLYQYGGCLATYNFLQVGSTFTIRSTSYLTGFWINDVTIYEA